MAIVLFSPSQVAKWFMARWRWWGCGKETSPDMRELLLTTDLLHQLSLYISMLWFNAAFYEIKLWATGPNYPNCHMSSNYTLWFQHSMEIVLTYLPMFLVYWAQFGIFTQFPQKSSTTMSQWSCAVLWWQRCMWHHPGPCLTFLSSNFYANFDTNIWNKDFYMTYYFLNNHHL
jgi:hypothetical protein